MNRISGHIPTVRFSRSSSGSSGGGTVRTAAKRVVKNGSVKSPQQSIQSESYRGPVRKHNKKAMKIVNHFAKSAAADIKQSIPLFYHPDFEPSSLILPKDRIEINSWCNYFYKYDALVATAIDMHSELPLSKIRLDLPNIKNKKKANRILEHYVDMIGNTGIDLFNKLLMMGVEYYKIGNVFPWAQMNASSTAWEKLTCLNPDYIRLEKLSLTDSVSANLVPDDRLRHIVHAGPYDEKTGLLYQTLSDDVIQRVQMGKEVPLPTDPNEGSHVAHLARKLADYVDWGTSIIERNFKTLVYKDRLRQSQDAIAARHLTPKHLVWAELASKADVNEIRAQVEDAMMNPDSAIITNYQLHWDLIGTGSSLMQLGTEREWITEDLLIGLMINKNVLLGEGTFASGQTVLEVLNQRYAIFREVLEGYIERNLFLPIARNNDFIEIREGVNGPEEQYIYPKVRWNRLNLTDDTQHKQMLAQAVDSGKVDVGTWLEFFGLNADTIAERLKANEDTVLDPSYNELRRSIMMEVGRSLGPSVAKVYADAYGLEMEDPSGGGGFDMFGAGKMPIAKFGKDVDINYDKEGNLTIKPKMIIEEHDIPGQTKKKSNLKPSISTKSADDKQAETREERRYERDINKSDRRLQDSKKKFEVVKTKKQMKPPRKDLKGVPKIFDVSSSVERQFNVVAKNDTEEQPKSTSTEIKMSASGGISSGYDNNFVLQSQEKVAEALARTKKIGNGKKEQSQELKNIGVDQHTRRLAQTVEDDVVSGYYRLVNSVKNDSLNKIANARVQQLYAGVYHSLVNPEEAIFKSSQAVKTVFSDDIMRKAAKLVQKIELVSSANRKVASHASRPEDVATKSREIFKKNEANIRLAVRSVVSDVVADVRGLMS